MEQEIHIWLNPTHSSYLDLSLYIEAIKNFMKQEMHIWLNPKTSSQIDLSLYIEAI